MDRKMILRDAMRDYAEELETKNNEYYFAVKAAEEISALQDDFLQSRIFAMIEKMKKGHALSKAEYRKFFDIVSDFYADDYDGQKILAKIAFLQLENLGY